jgi:serine phosphatase RsbU (regulator of sigma subunit)
VAISRRTTKAPKPGAARTPVSKPAVPVAGGVEAEAAPEAPAAPVRRPTGGVQQILPHPTASPASGRPVRRKSPSGRKKETSTLARESDGAEVDVPPRRSGGRGEGDSIGPLHRRGWSLAAKFSVFTLLVSVLITVLFGIFSIRDLRANMKREIARAGYQDVLVLKAFGQSVMHEIRKEGPQFGVDSKAYDTNKKAKDEEALKQIVEKGDSRIIDMIIFASTDEKPMDGIPGGRPVVRATGVQGLSTAKPAADIELPEGNKLNVKVYNLDYGGKPCLYLRAPLVESGDKMYASADVLLSSEAIENEVAKLTQNLIIVGLLFVGAGVGLSTALGYKITQPINSLVEDINTVSQGDLDHESLVPNETHDEIGLLAQAFNRMTRNLRSAREKERDSERLASELNTAQAIHTQLLPKKLPELPGIDIYTAYNCAKEVGGDYYDFIPVGDAEHLAFVVADVAGKGIPGSMVMGTTRTTLRMMAVNNLSASSVLTNTNYHVAKDIKRGMFVTCMYAILNLRTREMTIASAGHNPMLIWRAASGQIEKVRPNGIALGFDKGPVFQRTIREQKLRLLHGDRVVLYTDGVVEAMNEEHEEWGDEALDEFTLKHATVPSKEFVRLLLKALDDHKGDAEQHDDITVTTFRIT